MSNSTHSDDLRTLWQSMPTQRIVIPAAEMRAKARAFERKIRRRNAIEYIESAIVIAFIGWYATFPSRTPLWPIANLMIILGALVVVWNLHRIGGAAKAPETASVQSLIDFHRADLERHRKSLRSVWLWYVLPFVPGVVLWYIALWIGREPDANAAPLAIGLVLCGLLSVAVSASIIVANLLGAARLQRMIDELDSYGDQPDA